MRKGASPLESVGLLLEYRFAPAEWTVDTRQDGRSGAVVYRQAAGDLSSYWELGGGDTIGVIDSGDEPA